MSGEMTWALAFGGGPEDVYVASAGHATLAGLTAMTEEVLADARFKPNAKIIFDHRLLDWTRLSTEDARQRAADLVFESHRLGSARIAAVVSEPFAFGIQRMIEGLTDEAPHAFTAEVFYSLDEARAWLATLD